MPLLKAKEKGAVGAPSMFASLLILGIDGLEFGFEGWGVLGKSLDRQILGFVIGQSKVSLGFGEFLFHVLKMLDGLVDFVNRIIELFGRKIVVLLESGLKFG